MKSNVENSFEAEIADEYAKYETLTDEELIVEIKEHDNNSALDYLIHRYRSFVRAKARSYFLIGADREDIIQEGMIGFYKAVRDFKSDKLSSFHAFAELCVTRQIITAIKTATRQKHIPLNSYISLNDLRRRLRPHAPGRYKRRQSCRPRRAYHQPRRVFGNRKENVRNPQRT